MTRRILILVLVIGLRAGALCAQVAVDAVASGSIATNTTLTYAITCTAGAQLVVGNSWFADALGNFNGASAATYKGTNLTAAGAAIVTSSYGARIWTDARNLCDGTTGNVVLTASGSIDTIVSGAVSFTGAGSVADYTTASGSTTTPTVTVPNAGANDFIFDTCAGVGTWSLGTNGANQTSRWNLAASGNRGVGSTQDGADGGVMGWEQGTPDTWRCAALRIVASGGGGGSRVPSALTTGVGQ